MTAIAMMLLNANSLPGVNQMRMVDIIKTCHMILMFVCIENHAPVAMIVVQVVPMQVDLGYLSYKNLLRQDNKNTFLLRQKRQFLKNVF